MRYGIGEIMEMAGKISGHRERVNFLRENDSPALRKVCWMAYGPVEWDLPEKWRPDYRPTVYLDQQSTLYQSARRLDKFLVGGYPGLTREKKQVLFTQLLEAVAPEDARVLLMAKDGKLPKNLGRKVIDEAFPDLGVRRPADDAG